MNKNIVQLFLIILTLQIYSIGQAQISTSIQKQIDAIFESYDNPNTPGMSIGIVKDKQLVFQKSYGSANLEYEIPISEASLFPLASVSKQFTIFAILLLEQQGKLLLEDDVRKYIPELNDFGKKISLKHLANHTSGLRSDLQLLGMSGVSPNDPITMEQVFQMSLRQKELNFSPNEEFLYSNAGYVLLAEVVARVSGKTFQEFTQTHIFQPLQMTHTFWMDDAAKVLKNRTYGYGLEGGNYQKVVMNYSIMGSTGIWTTMEDFSKWALNFKKIKIGNRAIFDKMEKLAVLNNGQKTTYALGQFVDKYQGLERIHHAGGSGAFRAFLGRFPKEDYAFLMLTNNGTIDVMGKTMEVADLFLQPYFKQAVAEESISPKENYINLPLLELRKMEGRYLHSKDYYIRDISIRNDTLIYARTEQNGRASNLLPLSKNEFQMQGLDFDLKVVFQNEEKTMRILIDGEEVDIFKKIIPKEYSSKLLEQFVGTFYSEELQTSYVLKIKDKQLVVAHPRIGEVSLTPIETDGFLGSSWRFRYLKFERNAEDAIQGFRISSDRVRKVRFKKMKLE